MKNKICLRGFKAIDEITDILRKYQLSNMEAIGILFSLFKTTKDMDRIGINDIFKKGDKKLKQCYCTECKLKRRNKWQNED